MAARWRLSQMFRQRWLALLLGCSLLFTFSTMFGVGQALASSVSGVTFTPAGFTRGQVVQWDVVFTATTALTGGTDTITVTAPSGTVFPSSVSDYLVIDGFQQMPAASVTPGGNTVTVLLSGAGNVNPGDSVDVRILSVTNPAANTYPASDFSVATSQDTTAVNPSGAITFIPSYVGGVTFSASDTTPAASSNWTMGFTATTALTAGTDTITLTGPSGTVFPGTAGNYTVTDTTSSASSAVSSVRSGGGSDSVTIVTPVSAGTGDTVSVVATGVTNPAAGTYPNTDFTISTSQDDANNASGSLTFSYTPSAANSTVFASPTVVADDGTTTATVTVAVYAAGGSAIQGVSVSLAGTAGNHSTIAALNATTDASGIATFTVKDSTPETVTYTATAGTTTITQTAQVTFTALAPTVTAVGPTSGPAAGGTSVTITGTNFTGATAVDFGSTAATSYTVDSATQITATSPAGTGTVDVTVTTAGGTSATSSSDHYSYIAAPSVTGISPTGGLAAGGTSVTITGTGFTGSTAVDFGSTAATSYTVDSATQITATSPAGTGTVDVTVTTAGGTSAASSADHYSYMAAPSVTGISPADGPAAGGTSVTIIGTGFTGATAVDFGSTAATSYTVDSATQITATSPAGTGTVDVTVTTAVGTSAASSAQYFYVTPPAPPHAIEFPEVTEISPATGPATGGTSVTITGTDFTGVTAVDFGSAAATSYTVDSATQITATSPAGTGTVDVTVATIDGTSVQRAQDRFTYAASGGSGASTVGPAGGTIKVGPFTVTVPAGQVAPGHTETISIQSPVQGVLDSVNAQVVNVKIELDGVTAIASLPTDKVDWVRIMQGGSGGSGGSNCGPPSSFVGMLCSYAGSNVSVMYEDAWHYIPSVVEPDGTVAFDVIGSGNYAIITGAPSFPDVPAGYWAAAAIRTVSAVQIATGYPDGTFRPDAAVTRAQFVKMFDAVLNLPVGSGATGFKDVPAGAWYAPYVAAALRAGLTQGTSATTFSPGAPVTREEMAVMLSQALQLTGSGALSFTDVGRIASWARAGVGAAVTAGYLQGYADGSFHPLATATRAQTVTVLARVMAHLAPQVGP